MIRKYEWERLNNRIAELEKCVVLQEKSVNFLLGEGLPIDFCGARDFSFLRGLAKKVGICTDCYKGAWETDLINDIKKKIKGKWNIK